MNRETIDRFKGALLRRRELLLDWMKGNGSERVSRCDPEMVECVDNAIHRLHDGVFGTCAICHGELEPSRLALDYTAQVCLECLSEMDRRTLERELQMAAEVQKNLLPRKVPTLQGLEMAVHSQPAGVVGGDYFDFFESPGGGQSIAIADVMGKGLPASMLMSSLQASLRILGPEHDDLSGLATRLNGLFRFNLQLIKFISMILARIDITDRSMRYVNAGHNPALLWKASKRAGYWLQPTGPAIGLAKDPVYTSEQVDMDSGDVLVLYTDGLVEARDGNREEFGTTRLLEFTSANGDLPAQRFVAQLRDTALQYAGSRSHDDMTIMVVRATS